MKYPATIVLTFTTALTVAMAQTPSGTSPTRIAFSPLSPFTDAAVQNPQSAPSALVDFAKNQIVVVTTQSEADGSPVILRYDIPNRVNPTIAWSVSSLPSGANAYSYTVSDDSQSLQRSARISMLTPGFDTSLTRSDTSPWRLSLENTDVPDRSSTVSMAAMRRVIWNDPVSSATRISGLQLGLTSQFAPGFCDLYVEGQVPAPLTAEAAAQLPASILASVQQALSPGIGSVKRTGLCPLFRSDTPKTVVASNYYLGIQHLIRNGALTSASPYAQELSSYLESFLSSGGVGPVAAPAFEPGNAFERQIQNAIAIALK